MALSRRSVTATATLVVYLAGLVGGALHHHAGHGRHAGGDGPGQCIYRPGVFAADHGDNEDGCAV
ncbi:MAG TPA: hypothetical protein VJ739_19745, partial [Gemmataceae bacterium]|nr:hypothetical protein [Gemmataceae bacterium]